MSSRERRSIALLLISLLAIAAGWAGPARGDEPKTRQAGPSTATASAGAACPTPARGRMFVVGRVLDPAGKPVPGAAVMVHARVLTPNRAPFTSRMKTIPLADARADGSGRFRIDAPRTSSKRHEEFGAVALAPGYGAGWVRLDPDDDEPSAEISLRPERVILGRLFDLNGQPAVDVKVSVRSIVNNAAGAVPELVNRSVRQRLNGVSFLDREANDFPAWPKPTTTDSEGRFTVRGVGQNLKASLGIDHPRFAHQTIGAKTDDLSTSKTLTAALVPPQIVNVRVTYADTGQPVPHAPLEVLASEGRVRRIDASQTDADGHARVNSFPADRDYVIKAYPPEGEPYLIASGSVIWPKAALEQNIDIALPRGISVHGRVTEEDSGKPVAMARVNFVIRRGPNGNNRNQSIAVYTQFDGSFRLGAEPDAGYLLVSAPDDDYVFQSVDSEILQRGRPGGVRMYSHAHAALELKPGMGSQEVHLVVRRGATVAGRVIGPDGQPVQDAWVFSRLVLDPNRGGGRPWAGNYHGRAHNGRFEIGGIPPDAEVPVYFLEPHRKLGAVANLSARSLADGPVTVRLEPCGTARASLVDPNGKPVTKPIRELDVTMVMTIGPRPSFYPIANEKTNLPAADESDLNLVDPINYEKPPAPDLAGRLTLPVLIPGATYRFIDQTTFVRGKTGSEIRKEFTVKPGQMLLLGEIRLAKQPK